MRHLSFHEFPGLTTAVEFDPQLGVFTLRLSTATGQMVLIFTPDQLAALCDSMMKGVNDMTPHFQMN
jgi:hypothetical protein